MSKREKLFNQLLNNPRGATFAQIESLLLSEGFELVRVSGSHHIFKKDSVTFPIPVHGKNVKAVYVKRVIEIIGELRNEQRD